MCVDFTYLDVARPKNTYPLPNINRLINESFCYETLSFMDTYSDYNHIKMGHIDAPKIVFMETIVTMSCPSD